MEQIDLVKKESIITQRLLI